jgi:hypothetical protein
MSTGLTLRAIPSPSQAQNDIDYLRRQLASANQQLSEAEGRNAELEADLARERAKRVAVERGVQELRSVLTPLYQALGHVFGEMEVMGVEGSASPNNDPKAAVWESWKQKLGGKAAEAIDALRLHGEMTHTQLKIHIRCGQQTVYDTVHRLNKAGIINKNGGRVSLKAL